MLSTHAIGAVAKPTMRNPEKQRDLDKQLLSVMKGYYETRWDSRPNRNDFEVNVEDDLEEGANPRAFDELGRNALCYALESKDWTIINLFLNHITPQQRPSAYEQMLHYAAARNDKYTVQKILPLMDNETINQPDKWHTTALMEAAMSGQEAIVNQLLPHITYEGINMVNNENQTALTLAAHCISAIEIDAFADKVYPKYDGKKICRIISSLVCAGAEIDTEWLKTQDPKVQEAINKGLLERQQLRQNTI
jgi:ankyrin repeat protein